MIDIYYYYTASSMFFLLLRNRSAWHTQPSQTIPRLLCKNNITTARIDDSVLIASVVV